jgi:biotin carboxyl carrier protein
MKYVAIIQGERLEIDLTRTDDKTVQAEISGRKYVLEVEAVEPGVYWFQWNNQSVELSVTPKGEAYVVSAEGRSTDVEVTDGRTARRKGALQRHDGIIELRAPMPGKVVKVLVREGASVEANQGLLVVEAMKMQNEIKSPKKGIVRKLSVQEAAAVNAGDLLIVVE